MKRVILLLTICACTMAATQVNAQGGKASLSIGADAAIPTGDLSLITPFGFGGSAKFFTPFSNSLGLTLSAGYQRFTGKVIEDIKFNGFHSIPLKAGLRISTNGGFYFEPQAGYTFFGSKDADGESDGAFTYAGYIGVMFNNKVDISAGFESATKQGESLSHIGIRLAYNFSLGGKK